MKNGPLGTEVKGKAAVSRLDRRRKEGTEVRDRAWWGDEVPSLPWSGCLVGTGLAKGLLLPHWKCPHLHRFLSGWETG